MPSPKMTNEILLAAIKGFEAERERIESQIAELREMLSGVAAGSVETVEGLTKGKRTMSPAARRRIAEGQRKRWAAVRKSGGSAAARTPKAPSSKPRLSPEGRRKIIEATKKRWALYRASKAKTAKAGAAK